MATTETEYSVGTYGVDAKYVPLVQTLDRMARARRVLFTSIFDVISPDNPQKALRFVSEDPLTFGSAYSGSAPTAQKAGLSNHVLTVGESLFAKDVEIPYRDGKINPDLLAQKMVALVDMWGRHLESIGGACIAGCLAGTVTVPNGNGGTCAFFAASGAGHILNDGSSTELVNKGATGLSPSSLSVAKGVLWNWKDPRGNPLDLMGVPLVLQVNPSLFDLAIAITGNGATDVKTLQIGDSTEAATRIAVNPHGGISVVGNPYITDTNDWTLSPMGGTGLAPFKMWIEAPDFGINDSDGRVLKLQATYQARAFPVQPTTTTAYGASVT
jgi:hypothetical protein